jgi:hypothetical protein
MRGRANGYHEACPEDSTLDSGSLHRASVSNVESRGQRPWRRQCRVMFRLLFAMPVLTLLSGWTLSRRPVQQVSMAAAIDVSVSPDRGATLVFGRDGHVLHAIGSRAIVYAAESGAVTSTVALGPETEVFSVTSDGRTALCAVRLAGGIRVHLVLVDTETGGREDIPASWYDPEYDGPNAALSGDGRLVSIYSESGPRDSPMAVAVYDWPTKTLVATRTSEYISAGGGFGGGVTVDGNVEFVNNRVGRKLVNLQTGRLMGRFGLASVRAPDGAWTVEFPDRSWNESAPRDVLVKDGASGRQRGQLDVQAADAETHGEMTGVFCGTTGRFVLGRGRGVAVYAIPAGTLLASFDLASWRDGSATDTDQVSVACASTGARVAILSGERLTVHDLK